MRVEGFAVAPPGFRDVVAGELAGLGVEGVAEEEGGARFVGDWADVYRANLELRVASRVLVRVGRFRAASWGDLGQGLRVIPWDRWLPEGGAVAVRAAKRGSRLYHTGRIRAAAEAAVGRGVGARPARSRETGALEVLVRVVGAEVTVSLDTSGAHLHRRGYRVETGPAPLRENVAAGLLARAGWHGDEPLIDPLCGTGTLAVEGALIALGRAPGRDRPFAFQRLPSFDPARWDAVLAAAAARERQDLPAPVFASDRDPRALALLVPAARRAGLADRIRVAAADLADLEPPSGPGLLIANPPYGRRLGGRSGALAALGRALRGPFRHWRWAVVVPDGVDPGRFGLRPGASHRFRNGGIGLRLVLGEEGGP